MAEPTFEEKLSNQLADVQSYTILTEDIGLQRALRPSRQTQSGISSLGQTVDNALREILGWRTKNNDAHGFIAALNQSFSLKSVEGHVEWAWTPHTYTIAAEMGAVTGAQASIYTRAKAILDQSLPLLEGVKALRADFDSEDSDAIRAIVKSSLTELVSELGRDGGPRLARVDQLFNLLLGFQEDLDDTENVGGQLGLLRERFGLRRKLVNTIAEEQNLTNFLILVDNTNSLRQTWNAQRHFFDLQGQDVFLGTQLVLLSRALAVVAESVEEVYFAMDSVFLGPAERQVTELKFKGLNMSPIFLGDLLSWVERFATEEGPRLIKEGGKDGVINAFSPTVDKLRAVVKASADLAAGNSGNPTKAFHTPRVQRSLSELATHLAQASKLAVQIRRMPIPKPTLVEPDHGTLGNKVGVYIHGSNFQPGSDGTRVKLDYSLRHGSNESGDPELYADAVSVISSTLIHANFDLGKLTLPRSLKTTDEGNWPMTIVVFNPDHGAGSRDNAFMVNPRMGRKPQERKGADKGSKAAPEPNS